MGEANAIGRTVTLSPVTWTDGWPYFGLPGTWAQPAHLVKPNTGTVESRMRLTCAATTSQPQPFSPFGNGTMCRREQVVAEGASRIPAPACAGRNQHLGCAQHSHAARHGTAFHSHRGVGDAGLKAGDRAGLALLIQPDAWIGVEKSDTGAALVQHDGQTMATSACR